MGLVKFCSISKQSWTTLGTSRDDNTIYFLKDTYEIAKGADIYSMYEGGMRYMGSLESVSNTTGAPNTAEKTYTKGDIFVVTGSGTPTLEAMSAKWLGGNDEISGSGSGSDVNGDKLEAGDIVIINTTFGKNTTYTTYDLSYINVVNKNLDTSSVITTGSLKSLTFTDSNNNSIVYDPEDSYKTITLSTTALSDPVVSGNPVVTGISINNDAINLETQALSIGDGVLTLNVGGVAVAGNDEYSANSTDDKTYNIPVMDSTNYGVAKVCGSLGSDESISQITSDAYTYQPVYINDEGKLAARIPNAVINNGAFTISLGDAEAVLTGFTANTGTDWTYKIPAATNAQFGVVKVTTVNGLANSSGTISMKLAGTSEAGTIKVSSNDNLVGTLIVTDAEDTRYGVMTDTNGNAFVSIAQANNAWVDRGLNVVNGKIGHANNAITAQSTSDIYAITHDMYGHITGSTAATALMLELGTVSSVVPANTHQASEWTENTSVNEAIRKILDQLSWNDVD